MIPKNTRKLVCNKGWARKGRQGIRASRLETGTCSGPTQSQGQQGLGKSSNSSKRRTHKHQGQQIPST